MTDDQLPQLNTSNEKEFKKLEKTPLVQLAPYHGTYATDLLNQRYLPFKRLLIEELKKSPSGELSLGIKTLNNAFWEDVKNTPHVTNTSGVTQYMQNKLFGKQVYYPEFQELMHSRIAMISRPEPKPTTSDELKAKLSEHGFFSLATTKDLSLEKQDAMVELLANNDLPYVIAMLDYLGFLAHLSKAYYFKKRDLQKQVSSWFYSDKDGRTIRGLIDSLVNPTDRYNAKKYLPQVEKDHKELK